MVVLVILVTSPFSLVFLYIAGFIGWSVPICKQSKLTVARPESKEVIIDVPLALKCLGSGLLWPVAALQEFLSGDLVAKDEEIPISLVSSIIYFFWRLIHAGKQSNNFLQYLPQLSSGSSYSIRSCCPVDVY